MYEISENCVLLLLFKDDLPKVGGRGFSLVTTSETINKHYEIMQSKDLKPSLIEVEEKTGKKVIQEVLDLDISQSVLSENNEEKLWPEYPNSIAFDTCVWGWWRKPWEYHPELFEAIKNYCNSGKTLRVFLFNQYMRKVYEAKLINLYYAPYLTSVRIPTTWKRKCPSYYNDNNRLCGAFFVLNINQQPIEDAKDLLNEYYVDAESFELKPYNHEMIILPDIDLKDISESIIDKSFNRSYLKETDHTLLVLRKIRQKELSENLFLKPNLFDEELAESFSETEWKDICILLKNLDKDKWIKLYKFPKTLEQIGNKAIKANSRITRLDIELVSWAFNSEDISDLMASQEKKNGFSELGEALRTWVTSGSTSTARENAVYIFDKAWKEFAARYNLIDFKDYWEGLPGLEMVTNAVNYEINKKFYRDHLSHNIRAGLLSAYLVNLENYSIDKLCVKKIAFFSGLFHDIAFPISTFPETVNKLAKAIVKVQKEPSKANYSSLIDTEFLNLGLHYVALIACVPKLEKAFEKGCLPWENPDEAIEPANKRLLQELLLCAKSEDHAIVSAAIIFNMAIEKRNNNIEFAVKTLMSEMTTPNNILGKEFALILQSIALHDRKDSLKYHSLEIYPKNSPMPLNIDDFYLPTIVSIADELQDWGRPIGDLESIGITDAEIRKENEKYYILYNITTNIKNIESVPYSVLFNIFSKYKFFKSIIHNDKNDEFKYEFVINSLGLFSIELINYNSYSITVDKKTCFVRSKKHIDENSSINIEADHKSVLARIFYKNTNNINDLIVFRYENEEQKNAISNLLNKKVTLKELYIKKDKIEIVLENNDIIICDIRFLSFGNIKIMAPTTYSIEKGQTTILDVFIDRIDYPISKPGLIIGDTHKKPNPHFLDYDWRFTERSAKWIASAAHYYANSGKICYLGCPTVALYDSNRSDWVLIDKGHYALEQWIKYKLIDKEKYIKYNVFDELPEELKEQFDIVVADPPWYINQFEAFCKVIAKIIKKGGMLLITNYPPDPPYKEKKYNQFNENIILTFKNPRIIGSFEVDYEPPNFEKSWKGDKEFSHSGLGVYRPIYMDLYRIDTIRDEELISKQQLTFETKFEDNPIDIGDGDYIKYRGDIKYPVNIVIERLKTIHVKTEKAKDIIAWTTTNVIAKISDSGNINIDTLEKLVSEIKKCKSS